MCCKRHNQRFKTETVVYLTTRRKLLTVEHQPLSSDSEDASCSIRRTAGGDARLRSGIPVIITVTWRELATTVANEWNGNQMQIWLPFVFYTPFIWHENSHFLPDLLSYFIHSFIFFQLLGPILLTNSQKKITNTLISLDQTSIWYAKRR